MFQSRSFRHNGLLIQGAYTPESCEATYNLKTFPGDMFIVSYPRTGTTWTQNIMIALKYGVEESETMGSLGLRQVSPYLEIVFNDVSGNDKADKLEPPRIMKTHFPKELSPKEIFSCQRRCVLVLRNVKDTCVSYYHFYHNNIKMKDYASDNFEDFCERYLAGDISYGSQWEFNKGWLQYASDNPDTVLIIHYEDIKEDFGREVKKIAVFMGLEHHVSDEKLAAIGKFCSIDSMKDRYNNENSNVINFVREGQNETWKRIMSDEMVAKFDERTELYFKDNPDLLGKLM